MRGVFFLGVFSAFLLLSGFITAHSPDSLSAILKSKDNKDRQQQKIASLCYNRFLRSSAYDLRADEMIDSLIKYEYAGQQELRDFIQILIYRRKLELEKADKLLTKAIGTALKDSEKIFLYQFYLNQAYVQTDLGNSLRAVYNYRLARKVAEELGERNFLATTDIGISDIYMSIGLYPQALMYLDQAQQIYNEDKGARPSTQRLIYLNKAETHFKMGQLDSLRLYTRLASNFSAANMHKARDIIRLKYFILILENKQALAIPLIKEVLSTSDSYYRNLDSWYLATCYFETGELDSAVTIATNLLKNSQLGSSQFKLEAYKMLATIAKKRGQLSEANNYYELAIIEFEAYMQRISKIGDLSSEIRLDRVESGYHARDLIYEKERTILVLAVILTALALIVIFIYYRNVRQKNHFERLLHQARSKELAFINSHQVRRPLANIIGICSLVDAEKSDVKEMEHYLQQVSIQAKEMDDKLKEVEHKLRTQI